MDNATGMQVSYVTNTTNTHLAESILIFEMLVNLYYFMNVFSIVSYSITFLVGVIGNGLVIWLSAFKMIKTVNVIWFLNLAIADFIFDIFLPVHIVQMNYKWPFGNFMCKIAHTVLYLNMLVSTSFLALISMDRCLSVMCPVWSRNHRTPRLAYKIAFATWLLAVLISSPYPMLYDTTSPFRGNSTQNCFLTYGVTFKGNVSESYKMMAARKNIIITTRFLTMFLIPFAFIIICNGMIAVKIKNRKLSKASRPFRLIIIIVVLFFVCWFPYHTIPFMKSQSFISWKTLFRMGVEDLATCLAYFNTCLNPILYVFIGRDFKNTFRRSILSVFERALNEEPNMAALDRNEPPKSANQVDSHLL